MARYRIDDLARAADTTVRNVRVYQARGLLAPPALAGRVGWYSESHLARLRLIGQMLARGYTFATIAELLSAWESGGNLSDVLGIEGALVRPWSQEEPVHVTLADLQAVYGDAATPAAIARAVALGLIVRERGGFRVLSPRLMAAGAELVAFGIPLPAVLDLADALRRDMTLVADRFVALVGDEVLPDRALPPSERVPEVVAAVERLRPMAQAAVASILATAMEERLAMMVEDAARHSAGRVDELP